MKFNNVKWVRSVVVACTTVAMLLVGCNEPDVITPTPEPEPEPKPEPDVEMVVLKASTESTRTHLNEEYEVIWNEGDAITVFGSTDNYASLNEAAFAMTDGANTSTATFEGYLPEAAEGSTLYATYPDCWESPTEVAFPYEQKYVAGTFANKCCPMIAKFTAAQTDISFRNPFGIIEINLTGNVTVSSVTLSDAGYDLTDAAPATFTIDPETLALSGGSVNAAVITLKDINLALTETAQSLFVIVPPATYTALHVDVTCSDGTTISRTAENEVSVARNRIVPLATLNIETDEPGPTPDPDASEWSIVGTMNDWDATTGVAMYAVDGYFVAYNVELTAGDTDATAFKFVKNASWDDVDLGGSAETAPNAKYATVSEGQENISVTETGTYDIYLNEATDAYYIMTAGQHPSSLPPFDADKWYVLGDFVGDNWSYGFEMELSGDLYVLQDVQFADANGDGLQFKLRNGDKWFGTNQERAFALNETIVISADGWSNIVINGTANTKYDIYFDHNTMSVWVMEDGLMPDNMWLVKGDFVGDNWTAGVVMVERGIYHVAEDVRFANANGDGLQFKLCKGAAWYGTADTATVELNTAFMVSTEGSNNITVKGDVNTKYDIYLDTDYMTVWVMEDGKVPSDNWTIRGDFAGNFWTDVTTTEQDGYFVAEDIVFVNSEGNGASFKVLRNGIWMGVRAEETFEIHSAISFWAVGGYNIVVAAELGVKYDIYVDAVNGSVWVMTDGCKPGDAIPEPQPDPTPGDEASAGATTEQYERGEMVDPGWN